MVHSGEVVLEHRFVVAAPRQAVFDLLTDARNLNRMTPAWFELVPLTPLPVPMAVGTRIEYRLRWRSIPLHWRSRVVVWEPARLFTYEQESGPYRRFVHEHHFHESVGGTEVIDRVSFRVLGGRLIARSVVEPDLRRIFAFREHAARTMLAAPPGA